MNNNAPSFSFRLLPLAGALAGAACLFLASCAQVAEPAPQVASADSGLPWNRPRSSEASAGYGSMLPESRSSNGPSKASSARERPGLGTAAGYEFHDSVSRAHFYRKSSSPDAVASFYYNDEPGAKAMADLIGGSTKRSGLIEVADGRLRVGLVSYGDEAFPHLDAKSRQIFMGQPGNSYQIHLENRTSHTEEVIVSVDSLNVLTGGVAGYSQRGYVIAPKSSVNIRGFRVNDEKVRTFEFSSVSASKAAKQGVARNVGVVGLAVFEEDEAKAKMMLRKEQFQREDASAFPVSGR